MPLAVGVVAVAVCCAVEPVQMVVGGVIVAARETGEGADVGALCTLSPAVKTQRARRALQTMIPAAQCRAGRRQGRLFRH